MENKLCPLSLSCCSDKCSSVKYFTPNEIIYKRICCGIIYHGVCHPWDCTCSNPKFIKTTFKRHLEDYFSEKCEVKCSKLEKENNQLFEDSSAKSNELKVKETEIRMLQEDLEKIRSLVKEMVTRRAEALRDISDEIFGKLESKLELNMVKLAKVLIDQEWKDKAVSVIHSETRETSAQSENSKNVGNSLSMLKSEERLLEKSFEGMSCDLLKRCTIIRNVVMADVSPVDFVSKLANILNIPFKEADIEKIFQFKGNTNENMGQSNENVLLAVIFKTLSAKRMFILNKERLKMNQDTQRLDVIDYISKDRENILNFAKSFQNVVFKYIFYRNNEVYIKRSDEAIPVKMYSIEHVEDLVDSILKFEC